MLAEAITNIQAGVTTHKPWYEQVIINKSVFQAWILHLLSVVAQLRNNKALLVSCGATAPLGGEPAEVQLP